MKIIAVGDETRVQCLKNILSTHSIDITISDGDSEEDFQEFDIIFDLNFDDDSENFPIYAQLKNKTIFLSSVKQTLAESNFIFPSKIKSKLFGINAISYYLNSPYWEVSAFRGNEVDELKTVMNTLKMPYLIVDDLVGMYRPRTEMVAINEKIKAIEKGIVPHYVDYPFLLHDLKTIDEIGITDIFETLIALYEDTQDLCFLPTSLLKKKYLRHHTFLKK